MSKPRWKPGPPNKPGLWLVETFNQELEAWTVFWDRDDPKHDEDRPQRYLRLASDSGCYSEPIAWHHRQWPVRRCYGPIPKPRKHA